jgi:probable rRNA maturation factor
MLELQLSTQIQDDLGAHPDEGWLRQVVESTLNVAAVTESVEIGLVIADDATVQGLNRDHRGVDATTDVLAFAFTETRGAEDEGFVMPPGTTLDLGEVIISYPQAERQAEELGHSRERELALLIAHGVLHLLGHDHEEPDDQKQMRALEEQVLASLETV